MRTSRAFVLLIGCLLLQAQVFAQYRRPVPLMPDSNSSGYSQMHHSEKRSSSASWAGVALGFTGQSTNVPGNLLGVHMLFGGTLFTRFSIGGRWFMKPNIGFYTRGDGAGVVGMAQRLLELGGTLLFVPVPYAETRAQLGFTLKGDLSVSQLSAGDSVNAILPPAFRLRAGPVIGVVHSMSRDTNWTADLELTTPIQAQIRPYLSINTGLMFRW